MFELMFWRVAGVGFIIIAFAEICIIQYFYGK